MDGISKTRIAIGVFLGACVWASSVIADEEREGILEDDFLATSEALSDSEMQSHRGGDAIAENQLTQTSSNTIEGAETIEGGAISIGTESFAHQGMNVNVINSGNNANIQASAAYIVNFYGSMP